MNEEYDWDIFETFKEQLEIQLPNIEEQILFFDKPDFKSNAIDDVFRYFHTYKPHTQYLELQPFYQLVSKVETVLSILREDNKLVSESIIEWLLRITDQINFWITEMEEGKNILSSTPKDLLGKVQLTSSYIKPSDKLKELSLLYVDSNEKRAQNTGKFLASHSRSCSIKKNPNTIYDYLKVNKIDIIIINLAKQNFDLIKQLKEKYPDIHIIAVFDKITSLTLKKLLKEGISHTLTNPLSAKTIQRELFSIVKIFFASSRVIINHKKISDFIQTLQPLPNTIMQIMQICDDDEIPVKELIKVVKTDPIIAANILNIANSPLYSNVPLKTIDQAVAKFGKRVIKALAMSSLYKSLGNINLEAYSITEETFSKVSMNRLSLMLKWYAKVNIGDLTILSSTALLGNIGQLLIAKEIANNGHMDNFKNITNSVGLKYAEESLVHTTTNIISSQILNYWKLSKDIVDIISYSDNPSEAPAELKKLSVSNHIVYSLIEATGEIKSKLPDETLILLAEHSLDPKPLQNALKRLHEQNK